MTCLAPRQLRHHRLRHRRRRRRRYLRLLHHLLLRLWPRSIPLHPRLRRHHRCHHHHHRRGHCHPRPRQSRPRRCRHHHRLLRLRHPRPRHHHHHLCHPGLWSILAAGRLDQREETKTSRQPAALQLRCNRRPSQPSTCAGCNRKSQFAIEIRIKFKSGTQPPQNAP